MRQRLQVPKKSRQVKPGEEKALVRRPLQNCFTGKTGVKPIQLQWHPRDTPPPPPSVHQLPGSRTAYLPPHKKRKTARQGKLGTSRTGKTYARWRSNGRSTDLTTTTFPVSNSCRRDHTPSLLRTRASRASQF
ncbi:hypothetical protein AAFF_G00429560 [Aldrovandia affinis]|uniref:Uncharacterized protein n=1 Tax=Aldrovandia affinis TaxID=143900 RepID=A0AAD7VYS6_9TELE|nr:hypothetical protein AAFF_G00429560 [Aldrovandia affinis]